MNRSLKTSRIYRLGDYEDIRFEDEFNELPNELAFDDNLVSQIRFLQMLNVELAYQRYIRLRVQVRTMKQDEVLSFLEEEKSKTINEISNLVTKKE